jgi:RNA polymerase sigma-70 factor (ECF subfamily)
MHNDFIAIYEQHFADVYGFFAYRARNSELAEELTRQTFERALTAIGMSEPAPDDRKVWILTIARNTYIDFRAGSRSEEGPAGRAAAGRLPAGAGDSPLPGTELTTALAGLKRRERDAVALRFGGDLPVAQVARVLAVPTDEAKRLLVRALRRLAGLIDPPAPA